MLEELGVLTRGLVLGVVIAAPVGPVGLLCVRRTIQKGLLFGFASGFGAAFADAFFSAIAAFGVAAIVDLVQDHRVLIHSIGGALLLLIAWHTWHDAPKPTLADAQDARQKPRAGAWLGAVAKTLLGSFMITLTNPATLFGVLGVVATFGELHDPREAPILIAGVFAGSSLWWLLLSGGVALVRHRITENSIRTLNRMTGVILGALAVWALGSAAMALLGQ